MKKNILLAALISMTATAMAQEKGIRFEEGLSWIAIKQKAKAENKYILVDAYATWCGPCKVMDKDVYPAANVGSFINNQFVSVKIQQDKTPKDNEAIKSWYKDAEMILREFKVEAFPTFLFFSPEGGVVHRASGFFDAERFVALAKDALDPAKQYYTRIEEVKKGNIQYIDLSDLKELALSAKYCGDVEVAKTIARFYIGKLQDTQLVHNDNIGFLHMVDGQDHEWLKLIARPYISKWTREQMAAKGNIKFILEVGKDEKLAQQATDDFINSLSEKELYTPDNIEFLSQTITSSGGKSFHVLYNNTVRIDMVMGRKDFSQWTIDYIISKEEVDQLLWKDKDVAGFEPDWSKMETAISKKYNSKYAERVLVKAKATWYQFKENRPLFTKYLVRKLDLTNGLGLDVFQTNNACWDLFEMSTDKKELNRAIYWMEQLFDKTKDEKDVVGMDTYANLLYKTGRVRDAIAWQEKAVKAAPDYKEIRENLDKMKKGLPTWPNP